MNILFLTLMKISSVYDEGIYMDLMRCFSQNGHRIYIVSPLEKKYNESPEVQEENRLSLLKCETGNLFNVGMFEKGISQLLLPFKYEKGIEKFFHGVKFDLILYSTPPISIAGLVKRLKRKHKAATYLMLKDIFPQNAVDIGLIGDFTAKLFFKGKEKLLYRISDYIGCMSPANVEYLLRHNSELSSTKVEVCPNSINVEQIEGIKPDIKKIREKYKIPKDKLIFIYGGNLGLPQGIPFFLSCINRMKKEKEIHFVICGGGTEYGKLEKYITENESDNLTLLKTLSRKEYEELTSACDAGIILLDRRFTIPNFPSRLLSYMKASLPVLVCTDESSDMGEISEKNGFGKFCVSDDEEKFYKTAIMFKDKEMRKKAGKRAREYLEENYRVEKSYEVIMKHFE